MFHIFQNKWRNKFQTWGFYKLLDGVIPTVTHEAGSQINDHLFTFCSRTNNLKAIHISNLGKESLPPLNHLLINLNISYTLYFLTSVLSHVFLHLITTVVETIKSIKMYLCSTMTWDWLTDLDILAIESELHETLNFHYIIDIFPHQRTRKDTSLNFFIEVIYIYMYFWVKKTLLLPFTHW